MKEEFDHKYDLINVGHNYFLIKSPKNRKKIYKSLSTAYLKHSLKQGFLRVGLELQNCPTDISLTVPTKSSLDQGWAPGRDSRPGKFEPRVI